jgi:cytochrome oxidase Cu insertion factor (SCO1/SenC/PrrC family)
VDAMMEVGIVPPYTATSFAPNLSLNREEFAVALYRLYNVLNSAPASATLTAAQSSTTVNTPDQLTLTVTDQDGAPISSPDLAAYTVQYSVAAGNSTTTATHGTVNSSGQFTATAAGTYTVNASISGGSLSQPVTASVTITVAAAQPASATLTAAESSTTVNTADQLTLAVNDQNGNPISSSALAAYTVSYTVAAGNSTTTATDGTVNSSGQFTATAAGAYTVNVSISGGSLTQPVTASVTITVTAAG